MKRQTGKGPTVVRMCGELKHDGVTGRPLEMGGQTRESLQGDVDDEIESAVQMAERKTLAQRMEGPGVGTQLVCSRTARRPGWLEEREPSGQGQSERRVKADFDILVFCGKKCGIIFGVGRGDKQGDEMI